MNEPKFRAFIEQAPVAVCLNRNGIVLYCNKNYLKLFGFSTMEEVIDSHVSRFYAPRFRAEILDRYQKLRQGLQVPPEYESIALAKGGGEFPVHISIAEIQLDDGKANLAFIIDITERKKSEARIQLLLAENELILKEVHHRIKNNMNTMKSLISLQASRVKDEEAKAAFADT